MNIKHSLSTLTLLASLTFSAMAQESKEPYPREFVRPTKTTQYNSAESWPIQFDRDPVNLAPKDCKSPVLVIGTGLPTPNAFRTGPSLAVIANGYPYFVDAGEGVWRGIGQAVVMHGDWLNDVMEVSNLKYLFLTHLHEDHTVGIPTWILSPYKWGSRADKEIYGPKGTKSMIDHILAAWTIDIAEMQDGSAGAPPEGSRATSHDLTENGVVFEDDNVKVSAFRTKHGALKYTFAYRFETADRIIAFAGDGHYSQGVVDAAKDADILFTEAFSLENIAYSTWGGDTVEEKKKTISPYHMFPEDLVRIKNESGVKSVVLIHEQNYAPPEKYSRTGLVDEIKRAGLTGPIYSSIDGDIY
jgi:ribonuclease Z